MNMHSQAMAVVDRQHVEAVAPAAEHRQKILSEIPMSV